ncbi:RNA polymerase sigma factor, sigma-70 family [Spirochaeta africana DSM 8902]|uniref:RNA polymerase sigma factor, sigma-70 family n=1 Tax=Spirochaeta africana (strain ATCC 700263 / DSM 8902 / Z-7692) TaxID=889378 RepID=H9ULX7_SPIAZ|nr:RNA polymerase sigma factor, sigma-70 family [Spirochaeta africana DSM 8902]
MQREQSDGIPEFQEVYRHVFPIIYRVVLRIVNNEDAAEELVQEAFIKYYEHRERLADVAQAKYWLIRVSKNMALNYQKRKGREYRAYEKAFFEPKRAQETGETALLKQDSAQQVQDVLQQLPEKLRTVLVLKEYGGLSYKEIGAVMGIREGNVKVRVFRARERIAKLMEEGDVYIP